MAKTLIILVLALRRNPRPRKVRTWERDVGVRMPGSMATIIERPLQSIENLRITLRMDGI